MKEDIGKGNIKELLTTSSQRKREKIDENTKRYDQCLERFAYGCPVSEYDLFSAIMYDTDKGVK